MLNRPSHALITRVQQGTEPQILKLKFSDWDDVIAVDFTRTAESVQKTGADLVKWAQQQETKVHKIHIIKKYIHHYVYHRFINSYPL